MRLKDQLLAVSAAYVAASGMSEARLSTRIYGQGNRLKRLREGADMLSGNVEEGLLWLSEHWPPAAAWPSSVPRPAAPTAPVSPPDPGAPA